jgi:hypothetical protein
MSNVLKRITARAKQIRKHRPGMVWSDAISKATKQLKSEGVIGTANPQMSGHKKRTTKRRTTRTKAPRAKRTASPAPPRMQFENESISSLKSRAKKILKDQLGRKLAQKSLATGKRVKKKLGKEASAIRAQIIKFN